MCIFNIPHTLKPGEPHWVKTPLITILFMIGSGLLLCSKPEKKINH